MGSRISLVLGCAAVGGLGGGFLLFPKPPDATANGVPGNPLRVDVAGDLSTFIITGPTTAEGLPAVGAIGGAEGPIFTAGTFDEFGPNVLNPDGSVRAEVQDRVIGRWYCKTRFVRDLPLCVFAGGCDPPVTGLSNFSTQMFDFDTSNPMDPRGTMTIVTEGFDLLDNVPGPRAVTGGSGKFKLSRGQCFMTALGTSPDGRSFNISFEFDLSPKSSL